jgi:hypothetical protein
MTDRDRLQNLEIRITQAVCGGGVITQGEAEEAERLRGIVGETYDAITGLWTAYDVDAKAILPLFG